MSRDVEHPVVVLLGVMIGLVGFSFVYFLQFVMTWGLVLIPTMLVTLLIHAIIDLDRFAMSPVVFGVVMVGIPLAITTYLIERSGEDNTMRYHLAASYRRIRDAFSASSRAHSMAAIEAEERLQGADYETLESARTSGSPIKRILHALHFGCAVLSGPLTLAYGLWWVFGSDDVEGRLGMGIFFGIPLLAAWYIWIQFAGSMSTESALSSASQKVGERVLRERAQAQAGTLSVATSGDGGELSVSLERDGLTQVELDFEQEEHHTVGD